jgi:hypothetical protein
VLTLKANAATDLNSNAGPIANVVSSGVLLDLDAPTPIAFAKSASTRAGLVGFELNFAEPVTGLTAQSFTIHGEGCVVTKFSGAKDSYALWLTDCAQGAAVSATLKAQVAQDAAGNLGPIVPIDSVVVAIDDVAPSATVSVVTRSPQPVFEVAFSEAVQGLVIDSFSHSGTATGCHFALSSVLTGLTYRVSASGCSAGTVRLELPSDVVIDGTGNLGPASLVSSDSVTIERAANQGGATPAHLKSHKVAANESSDQAPSEKPKAKPQSGSGNVFEQLPSKPKNIAKEVEVSAAEPVNRNLGYAALALAVLLLGVMAFRRVRR